MAERKTRHTEMTPEALDLVAARFRVLAEPVRLRILQALDANGEMSIGALTAAVELSQPNVSKHVKILTDAGLVTRRQDGNVVYCAVADESVFRLCDVVCSSLRDRLTSQSAIFKTTRASRR
jgi:DNA-binding transcriptional ArsR family regulator